MSIHISAKSVCDMKAVGTTFCCEPLSLAKDPPNKKNNPGGLPYETDGDARRLS